MCKRYENLMVPVCYDNLHLVFGATVMALCLSVYLSVCVTNQCSTKTVPPSDSDSDLLAL